MADLRFTRSFEEFRDILEPLAEAGDWKDLSDKHKQFHHHNRGVMNWYPTTGTINFAGKTPGRTDLELLVRSLLAGGSFPAAPLLAPVAQSALEEVDFTSATTVTEGITVNSAASHEPASCETGKALGHSFCDSELVIALVGAVGTKLDDVVEALTDRLKQFDYHVEEVRVSRHVIEDIIILPDEDGDYRRIMSRMDAGDLARDKTHDNAVLALGVASVIRERRMSASEAGKNQRKAFIVNSLKHPSEVERLKEIYDRGFYLIGVHSDEKRRYDYLTQDKDLSPEEADRLIKRDADEQLKHGQRVTDTFHLSDFFVRLDQDSDKFKKSLWRFFDILFGHPYKPPTFDEYAMFMAFSASLRSADLSRQVGAVLANQDQEIIATGANDCPKFGGGLYWPEYNEKSHEYEDYEDGRDYMRGEDANRAEQQRMIEDVIDRVRSMVKEPQKNTQVLESLEVPDAKTRDKALRFIERILSPERVRKALKGSRISDITEYGRVVHAEMEAILSCARNDISLRHASLYCTTFPCHNCAKHIVAAGIRRVVYVEPYPKSKAAELHSDSISLGSREGSDGRETVLFEPFVGVGPRRFFDLFSMRLGSGYELRRKDGDGQKVNWNRESSRLRVQMLPLSYKELEKEAAESLAAAKTRLSAVEDQK